MLQSERIAALFVLCQELIEQAEHYQEAFERDDIFEVKRDILSKIRQLEKKINDIREADKLVNN
jgi:hypothetical protein